jgi:hypothetical protein
MEFSCNTEKKDESETRPTSCARNESIRLRQGDLHQFSRRTLNPGDTNLGDTKIISVCRVSEANDGGAGGDESISRGTECQVFRGRAAGKRMKTRSDRDNTNEIPQPR